MRIAAYKGISWQSRAIRFLTRSAFSHACFTFDEQTVLAIDAVERSGVHLPKLIWRNQGAVVEAWTTGLRNVASLSSQHTPNTEVRIFEYKLPLTLDEEMRLIIHLHSDIGADYGFWNVLRFVTKRRGRHDKSWFCSQHVFNRSQKVNRILMNDTQDWEVSPRDITKSRELNPNYVTIRTHR